MDICKPSFQKLVGLLSVKKDLVSEYVFLRNLLVIRKDFEIFRPSCSIPLDVSDESTFISPFGDFSLIKN